MVKRHTPGPWTVDRLSGGILAEAEGSLVVHDTSLREPDAHLIAAAPDLLEAAKRMQSDWGERNLTEAIQMLGAAIAKAEGK